MCLLVGVNYRNSLQEFISGIHCRNSFQEFKGRSTLGEEKLLGVESSPGWGFEFRRWFHPKAGKASQGGRAPEAEYIQEQEKLPGVELSPGLGL